MLGSSDEQKSIRYDPCSQRADGFSRGPCELKIMMQLINLKGLTVGQTLDEVLLLNGISLNAFYKPLRWVLLLSLLSHKRFVPNLCSYETTKWEKMVTDKNLQHPLFVFGAVMEVADGLIPNHPSIHRNP